MIWDKQITTPFTNPAHDYSQTPDDFKQKNFLEPGPPLSHIVARSQIKRDDLLPYLIKPLLGGFGPDLIGLYNTFYRNSTYVNGLDHPVTVRLGHM